jgi:hypothetical protein
MKKVMNDKDDVNKTLLYVFLFLAVFSFLMIQLVSFITKTERESLNDICIEEYGPGSYVVKTGRLGDPLCFSEKDTQLMGFPPSRR